MPRCRLSIEDVPPELDVRTLCPVTVEEQSGQITRWRFRLAELDLGVKYKKGKINAHAYAVSGLQMTGKIVLHDYNDDIPVPELNMVLPALGPYRSPCEVDYIDTEYAAMDELYTAVDDPVPTILNTEPISVEELL